MMLVYVDESYSKDWYFVAGVAVTPDNIRALEASLQNVVDRAVDGFGVGARRAELHGHPLFRRMRTMPSW